MEIVCCRAGADVARWAKDLLFVARVSPPARPGITTGIPLPGCRGRTPGYVTGLWVSLSWVCRSRTWTQPISYTGILCRTGSHATLLEVLTNLQHVLIQIREVLTLGSGWIEERTSEDCVEYLHHQTLFLVSKRVEIMISRLRDFLKVNAVTERP